MTMQAKTSLLAHRITTKEVPSLKQNENLLQRLADQVDLQSEPLPALPIAELAGDRRLMIENHQGVSAYSRENICVKVKFGLIQICGCDLELARMTRDLLVIRGSIDAVKLIRR